MAPIPNPRVLFNQVPTGYPVDGETCVYDTSATVDLDAPLHGGVLIKLLVLSIDPYIRGRMRAPEKGSYSNPFKIGEPLQNFGVAVVLRSEAPEVKAGDHVYYIFPFQTYITLPNAQGLRVLENKEQLPWSAYVGVAGMAGQTAYVGWKAFSKAKKGETVFITTAGGAVGSVVLQLAKAQGLRVIASAGSDEKVAFAKELGADVAFNYKTKDTKEALAEIEGGIDIYWDNVGGEMLEAAIDAMNNHGRIISCGMISGYNSPPYFIKNLFLIIGKRLSINGFIVSDHRDLLTDFYKDVPARIAAGEIKHQEHVYKGLIEAGKGIVDVQRGLNTAKAVVVLDAQ